MIVLYIILQVACSNKRNTVIAVGLPDFGNGMVNVYNRASESNNYILIAELVSWLVQPWIMKDLVQV